MGLGVAGSLTTARGNLSVVGDTSLNGAVTIQSSAPVLSMVDTDDNSDFRIRLEDGHIRFQDTTNGNRDFMVANSSGDVNLGVAARTTAIMGLLDVNGEVTVQGLTSVGTVEAPSVFGTASMRCNAYQARTAGGATLFDNASSGTITVGNATTPTAVVINATTATVAGDLTVTGDTALGNAGTDTTTITGETSITGDLRVSGAGLASLVNLSPSAWFVGNTARIQAYAPSKSFTWSYDNNPGCRWADNHSQDIYTNGNVSIQFNSSNEVTIPNGKLTVTDSIEIAGSNAVTDANTVSGLLEVWSGSVVKTTVVTGFTPTGAWQNLFNSSYPFLTIPNTSVGDVIEVRGTFAEDHANNAYPNMSSVFQYVVREGTYSGADIGGDSVSAVAGGDNGIENAQGHYYTRATVTTAGSHFIGLRYKASNTVARDMVRCAQGSNSSLFVTVRRGFTLPTL